MTLILVASLHHLVYVLGYRCGRFVSEIVTTMPYIRMQEQPQSDKTDFWCRNVWKKYLLCINISQMCKIVTVFSTQKHLHSCPWAVSNINSYHHHKLLPTLMVR